MANKSKIKYRDAKRKIEFLRPYMFRDLRAEDDKKGNPVVTGYAAVWDQETVIGDYFREILRKGMTTKTLTEIDQLALWSHNREKPLARRTAGTLTLREDEHGLHCRMELGNQSWALDCWESIRRGDVKGMSFGFRVMKAVWHDNEEDEMPLREVLEISLYEVSPVTDPAYEGTEIQAEDGRSILRIEVDEEIARSIVDDAIERGEIKRSVEVKTTDEPDQTNHSPDPGQGGEPDGENHSAAGARIRRMLQNNRQRRAKLKHTGGS